MTFTYISKIITFSKGKQKARSFMRQQAMFFHRQEVHYKTTQLHGRSFKLRELLLHPKLAVHTHTQTHTHTHITWLSTQLYICPDCSPQSGQIRCCIATGDAASSQLCSVQSVFLTSQAKPSQSVKWGADTCASTSPCLLAIPAFDRTAGLSNRHLNCNRGLC